MDWKDLAGVVSKAAPVLGGILGGPAGVAVGGLVATALGTDASPDSVSAAILRDPQAAIKLKELETNSRVQLQQLAVTAEQNRLQAAAAQHASQAADRDSARRLAAQQPRDWVRPAVTVLLLLGAAGIVFFVFSGMAEGLLRDATASLTVGTVIGYWFNELKQVLAFWFGTTGETQRANAEVRQFAVSPGSVTFPDDAGGR
ncbi:hypothetical protein O9649_07095 [Achromobacter dolens]|uniref:Uncharacterized protein n=1 Tax=Achromobacter dolens TaxID=1287738 RepID=A0A6S7C1A8_9BURK|nr:hypothetical protein [Achromobacter dolens]MCZ8407554.1 hypothetical protein [Achromobacter dolens]CAB3815698.1 hypothetical protein LMG26841_00174 [Achromobacter dolens]CAB3864050.1 hypothetical protein LMG26842_03507 [Achromobacter dolens]